MTPYQKWDEHLNNCNLCRIAIRGRFASQTILHMAKKCCESGKTLYLDFVATCPD